MGVAVFVFGGLLFVAFFAGNLDAFEFVAADESFAEHFAAGVEEEGGVAVLGAGEAVEDGLAAGEEGVGGGGVGGDAE